jgi:phosphopantetheinyl transferase (holo-ACP synthase)
MMKRKTDHQISEYVMGTARVLVWRLDEDVPRLLDLCREAGVPVGDLLEAPAKRQREKAAERLLLHRAFGRPVTLQHDEQGAPSIEGHEDTHISITHTMELVAIALDDSQVIGLDAERIDRKQVLKVRDKFLNASEQQFISPDDLRAHIIAWTAKEAIIKAERNSAIDWTDGICLEPFTPSDDETLLAARCAERRYSLISRLSLGHYITLAKREIE